MFKFEEVFGFPCGSKKKDKESFDLVSVDFSFQTPNNRVNEIAFDIADSMALTGNRILIIANHPLPELGDPGIIAVQDVEADHQAPRLSLFVNDTAEDPKPPMVRDSTQPSAYPKPRDTWLKPGRTYYGRAYYIIVNQGQDYPPITLQYYGTGFEDELSPEAVEIQIDGIDYLAFRK